MIPRPKRRQMTLTRGVLRVRSTFAGDFNLDGTVNTLDFTIMAANFNKSGIEFPQCDANFDGVVNVLDFNAVASNFGQTAFAAGSSSAPAAGKVAPLSASPAPRTSLFADVPIKSAYHDLLLSGLSEVL